MSLWRLLLASLWRFRRTNLGVLLGVAVATTVITGALIVGDSMRHTLSQTANQRLGNVSHALIGSDRFFTDALVQSLGDEASGVVMLQGVVSTPDGTKRANEVALVGVDERFAALLGGPAQPIPGEAVLNDALARQLNAAPGDTLILRVPEPSALPIDAALINASKPALAIRVTVSGIIGADEGGRFSLRAEQRTPMNLFVNRAWLAEQLGVPGRVNAALMPSDPGPIEPSLDDLELTLTSLPERGSQLASPRVFLDASIERDLADLPGPRLLTYMVNTIALGDAESPYAMVTAADGLGELQLADDEIAINTWLAEDLGASVGDTLSLTYYLPDEGDRLVEATAELRVVQLLPIAGVYADRSLTPDFPGLDEAESLRNWDAGPAIDRSRIRDKDEAYWDDYRVTPKAFISLETGQRLWSNRFGTLTKVRFDEPTDEVVLLDRLDAVALGFEAIDIGAQAKSAAKGTVDFGQLFLSLSGFIIIAAIVLTATLFTMSVEQRAKQLGALLAIGLTRRQVFVLIVGEGGVVALLGTGLGLVGGLGYAAGVVHALSGVWAGAVAGTAVVLHVSVVSLVAGPIGALVICVLAMAFSLRALVRRPARELLAGAVGKVSGVPRLPVWVYVVTGLAFAVAALLLVWEALSRTGMSAGLIGFGAGASLFGALVVWFVGLLVWPARVHAVPVGKPVGPNPSVARLSASRLTLLSLTRRRGRTTAAVVTLGCGVFLVLAVAGFRLSASDDPTNRASGTGGFALMVESSQPIRYDLNTALGRDHYFFDEDELPPGSVVPFRVSDGDDASCLNLNQTQTPRLLGVDPAQLQSRSAFTFQQIAYKANGWGGLNAGAPLKRNTIPAVADANTAQWALKLKVGDTLTLANEQGRPFTLELVGTIENSILQGSLIIDERAFERLYPATSGHRLLLVDVGRDQRGGSAALLGDARNEKRNEVASLLEEVMVDEGVTVTATEHRLAEYNRVQNTYLVIFQMLGGLGVVLGAMGLGVIAARNLLERRAELALLSAVGWSRGRVTGLVLAEHAVLLTAGLGVGVAGAWAATLHAGRGWSAGLSGPAAMGTVAAVLIAGLLAVFVGLHSARSGRLTDALRSE